MTSSLRLYGTNTKAQDFGQSDESPNNQSAECPNVVFTAQNLGVAIQQQTLSSSNIKTRSAATINSESSKDEDHANTLLFSMIKNIDYIKDEEYSMDEYGEEEMDEDQVMITDNQPSDPLSKEHLAK